MVAGVTHHFIGQHYFSNTEKERYSATGLFLYTLVPPCFGAHCKICYTTYYFLYCISIITGMFARLLHQPHPDAAKRASRLYGSQTDRTFAVSLMNKKNIFPTADNRRQGRKKFFRLADDCRQGRKKFFRLADNRRQGRKGFFRLADNYRQYYMNIFNTNNLK